MEGAQGADSSLAGAPDDTLLLPSRVLSSGLRLVSSMAFGDRRGVSGAHHATEGWDSDLLAGPMCSLRLSTPLAVANCEVIVSAKPRRSLSTEYDLELDGTASSETLARNLPLHGKRERERSNVEGLVGSTGRLAGIALTRVQACGRIKNALPRRPVARLQRRAGSDLRNLRSILGRTDSGRGSVLFNLAYLSKSLIQSCEDSDTYVMTVDSMRFSLVFNPPLRGEIRGQLSESRAYVLVAGFRCSRFDCSAHNFGIRSVLLIMAEPLTR